MDSLARPFLFLFLAATTAFGQNTPPVIDDPVPNPNKGVIPQFPVGKTLIFPITAVDPDVDDSLTYKVTSNNPKMLVRVKTGNPTMRFTVNYGAAEPGQMEFLLFREWTPVTSGFIGGFAQSGFYDNVKFHRVIKNFVIQGGDPLGTGQGGPGMTGGVPSTAFKYDNEFLPGLLFTGRGQLAMANSGYGSDYSSTNGSQFFVTLEQLHVPTAVHQLSLDFKHSIFGQMLRGWDVLDAIANLPVNVDSKPTPDVVITSATVEANNRDAVLMLSATGRVPASAPATITVTATDGNGGTSTKTFTVSTVDDAYNSPPVVLNVPPLNAPKERQYDFPLQSFDLEADYLFLNHGLLGSGVTNAASTNQGFAAAVLGNAGFEGQVQMGLEISQFNVGAGSSDTPVVKTVVPIGIGDLPLRTDPMTVKAAPTLAFTGIVARFKDLDPAATAANYTTPASNTTINWGDGTPVQNGTFARDTTVPGPANFAVTGTHTYAKPGIYTIIVTAVGNKGTVGIARTQAIVSSQTLVAAGQHLEVKGATASNRIVATFTDSASPGRPGDYKATVDWGDGLSSKGVITKLADKSFVVRGTHTYKDAEPFAISVRIEKTGATDAIAWSTANITGFKPPQHLPPFPMVHMVGAWNSGPNKQITNPITGAALDPTKLTETLSGAFVVINSGTKASAPSRLRFWLSNNTTVEAGDTALQVNALPEISVGAFTPGSGGQGTFTIALPKGQSGAGKYLLSELVYTDPIIDASRVDKVIATGPIDPAVVVYDLVGQLGRASNGAWLTKEGDTTKTVTFKVLLDTPPTSDVTIVVESSVVAEGTVSPATLTFTAANWNTGQTVTVTGADDAAVDGTKAYTVTLKAPTSTDVNYTGLPALPISFANLDND